MNAFLPNSVKILIPSLLRSYTSGEKEVTVPVGTLLEALNALDEKFPGIKFRFIDEQDRVRPHMLVFVNGERVDEMGSDLSDGDEIFIIQSLSGG